MWRVTRFVRRLLKRATRLGIGTGAAQGIVAAVALLCSWSCSEPALGVVEHDSRQLVPLPRSRRRRHEDMPACRRPGRCDRRRQRRQASDQAAIDRVESAAARAVEDNEEVTAACARWLRQLRLIADVGAWGA